MLGNGAVAELIPGLLPPGGKVLDVGCGGGHTLAALASRGVQGIGWVAEELEKCGLST